MPQQQNITVKKNDGTTDITYTALQPSSGDGVQAVWKSTTIGTAQAHQPELRCSAKVARGRMGREVRVTFVYPSLSTDSTTGITSVISRTSGQLSFSFDGTAPTADVNEAVAQFTNLVASAAMKAIVQSGYGPT
jgi:hypothetical protein